MLINTNNKDTLARGEKLDCYQQITNDLCMWWAVEIQNKAI